MFGRLKYLDKQGTVEEAINPHSRGQVCYQNTTSFAICPEHITLLPGQPCQVVDTHAPTFELLIVIIHYSKLAIASLSTKISPVKISLTVANKTRRSSTSKLTATRSTPACPGGSKRATQTSSR